MAGFACLFGDLGKEAAHPVADGDGGIAHLGQPDHLWAEPVATGFCVLFKQTSADKSGQVAEYASLVHA